MTVKKANPKKRGVKSYYQGSRLAFLEGHFNEYVSLRGKSRHNFWHRVYNTWWERYPWRLPDDEEPPTHDPERMKEVSHVGGDEDREAKAEVEAKARKRIAAWFSNRASARTPQEGGDWIPILKHVHQHLNPKPRCRSVAQQLMNEEPDVIKAAFKATYGDRTDMNKIERLNKLNEIARELTTTEYAEMVPELEQRAKEVHARELKEWELDLDKVEEAEDVSLARDTLFSAVHPLLQFIGRYSGCYVTLLAAAQDDTDDKPYFSTIHHFPQDASMRVNWTDFNEQGFKDGVVHPFIKYIRWMEGTKGERGDITKPAASITTVPTASTSPFPSALPTTTPTSRKPRESKKRGFHYTEGSSDDEDVDMDIDSNDSSGSSVGSDHVPAKRLRTATIVTRSSRTTPAPSGVTPGPDICHDSPSSTDIRSIDLDDLSTETEAVHETEEETGPETGSEIGFDAGSEAGFDAGSEASFDAGSELETELETGSCPEFDPEFPGDTRASIPGTHVNVTKHTTTPLRHSPVVDIDVVVNGFSTGLGTGNTGMDSARHVRNPISTSVAPSRPPSPSPIPDPSEVPAFLIGKNNVYGYLSCAKETGFRNLLKVYITFELADRSCVRSGHSTTNRPHAVGWWTSRARPNKPPPYDSLKSFTKSIITWWVTIQPRWRKIKPGTVSRVEGDWEYIYKPGINGFLNIVALAYWWSKILEERGSGVDETYVWFVSDVTWVLTQLTKAAREDVF